jgi:hypothetical protein
MLKMRKYQLLDLEPNFKREIPLLIAFLLIKKQRIT